MAVNAEKMRSTLEPSAGLHCDPQICSRRKATLSGSMFKVVFGASRSLDFWIACHSSRVARRACLMTVYCICRQNPGVLPLLLCRIECQNRQSATDWPHACKCFKDARPFEEQISHVKVRNRKLIKDQWLLQPRDGMMDKHFRSALRKKLEKHAILPGPSLG